jgi:hypothetical protein
LPHLQICCLSRGGPEGHCRYPTNWVPYAQDLSQVPRCQTPHPAQEGSSVPTCPVTSGPPPDEGRLRCHHVSHGSGPASRCGRALVSWHVSWHRARLLAGEGSNVATCPMILDPPPGAGGLWRRHVSHGSRRAMGHKKKVKYSASLLTWLGPPTSEACPCIPKTPDIRLIMTSLGTRSRQCIKYIQDSYTQCMGSIKCVKDSDTARQSTWVQRGGAT